MLMKLSEIIGYYGNLTKPRKRGERSIVDQSFPAKLSLAISRNVKRLQEESATYEKEREKICERLAEKGEDGLPIIVEKNGKSQYKLTDENLKILDKELAELLGTEIDVPIQMVDSSVLEQCDFSERYHTLSAREAICLDFMIKEGDE